MQHMYVIQPTWSNKNLNCVVLENIHTPPTPPEIPVWLHISFKRFWLLDPPFPPPPLHQKKNKQQHNKNKVGWLNK